MQRIALEIGDPENPLEADIRRGILRTHPHIGLDITVNDNANESLKPLRGKHGVVTGVVIKRGQIAGYEVSIESNRYYAPRKDFFVEKYFVEDTHLDSALASHVQELLNHWGDQHDYYGPAWEGVEAFNYQLAKAAPMLAVESAGWYKYPSSTRSDMDGKDWRLLIPDTVATAAVNCHSILHDAVWTLSTTIYSTRDIDPSKLKLVGDQDHWTRVYLWTMEVAKVLQTHGYDYTVPIADLTRRMEGSRKLRKFGAVLLPHVYSAYRQIKRREPVHHPISYGYSYVRLKPKTVGKYDKPTDDFNYGIINVHPVALDDPKFAFEIVKHELIHLVLEASGTESDHDESFQKMAELLNLPKEYRG